MGCTSSKDAVVNGRSPAALTRGKNRGVDQKTVSDDQLESQKPELLQRHDTDIDIISQIAEERVVLKALASVKICRKQSCEDLMDALTSNDMSRLQDEKWHRLLQKQFCSESRKQTQSADLKHWVMYNNLEAIDEVEINMISKFMRLLLDCIAERRPELLPDHNIQLVSGLESSMDFRAIAKQKEQQQAKQKQEKQYSLRVRQLIRRMNIVKLAPLSHFQLRADNLYDYELPPGLITVNEARVVIELYRRGGRLMPVSVHKILRLGVKLLSARPNIQTVNVRDDQRLVIVGDLHGQLADLLHILDANGLPGDQLLYVFNGDFVDRGDWGIEVLMILLSLVIARPDAVYLNRGNHEDFAICTVYGFQSEVYEKYDPVVFACCVEVFQALPLFALVNEQVFVVHGGLFHTIDVTLSELQEIDRRSFYLDEQTAGQEDFDPVSREKRKAFLDQLARDSLWSDPCDSPGMTPSQRGAGIAFGPDITRAFLRTNRLLFVLRSHECVRSGYDEPYQSQLTPLEEGDGEVDGPLLCTIFSASDYGGSGNSAAYLVMQLPVTSLSSSTLTRAKTSINGISSMVRKGSVGGDLSMLDIDPPPALLRHPSIGSLTEAMITANNSDNTNSIVSPISNNNNSNHHSETALAGHSHISYETEEQQHEIELEAMLQAQNIDNQSEEKHIPGTALYYTVHYFFAEPLRFDAHLLPQQPQEIEEDGDDGDSISRLLANAGPSSTSDTGNVKGTANDLTILAATSENTQSQSAQPLSITTNTNNRPRSSAPSTLEIDSSHHETKLLGSARTLEDLLVDRRQLLTEQLLRVACALHNQSQSSTGLLINGNGNSSESLVHYQTKADNNTMAGKHVSLQDWAMVMNEAMNLSINWKRFGRYLLDPSAHLLRCPVTGLDCVDIEPWLASFEDEISRAMKERDEEEKEKEKEQAKQSMHDLSLFIDSSNSSNGNGNGLITIDDGEVDPDMVLVSVSSLTPSKQKAEAEDNTKELQQVSYHGYKLSEEVIEAIYSQYKLVNAAYEIFDPKDEGQFSMAAFTYGLRQLGLYDHLDDDKNGTDASDYKGRHHSSPDRLFAAMDLYDEELVDRNAFFEVYRLCCLNSLYLADDTAIRPQIKRENTHANQIHRLSMNGAPVPVIMPANHHHLHSHQTTMELAPGRTLSVDAELAYLGGNSGNSANSPTNRQFDRERHSSLGERRNSMDRRNSFGSEKGEGGGSSHQPFSSSFSSSAAIDI